MIRDDRQREAGAVAVVVALVVTLVLIPVGALALDLGATYTYLAALQRAADAAATAGAQELARQQRQTGVSAAAAIQAARSVAISVLCHDPVLDAGPQWLWHDPCTNTAWATDGDTDPQDPTRRPDGEIEFYTGTPNASTGQFTATQVVPSGGTTSPVSGIRVVTPPLTVRYGLAAAIGISSARAQRSATAQLLTVLPVRDYNPTTNTGANVPLYLTAADLAPAAGGTHSATPDAFCARSAPREAWSTGFGESLHPTGVACDPSLSTSVPRGYLADTAAALLRPGAVVHLQPQVWTQVARVRILTPSLFGSGGRLVGTTCPGGNGSSTGGYPGVEAAYLGNFTNTSVGSSDALKAQILSGNPASPAQEGWLSTDVLRCGRLAVIPVLSGVPAPPGLYGLSTTAYPVASLRLVWFDSVFSATDPAPIAGTQTTPNSCLQRGFYWENATWQAYCPPRDDVNAPLRALIGYVLDPRLLPATVQGTAAANVTPYLASGLPATVRLVRDLSDPPAT